MAKLYYEATIKILVDADDEADRDVVEGKLAEQLTELHDIEEGVVLVTDCKLELKDAK
jgi:hypothetical protein